MFFFFQIRICYNDNGDLLHYIATSFCSILHDSKETTHRSPHISLGSTYC